jgi:cytochrome c
MKLRSVCLAMGLAGTLLAPVAYADLATAQKGGCMGCHKVDAKLVGPAYKDVAAKYKGQKDAIANLMDRVRKGGPGNWGTVPMAASGPDKISDADLKKVIEWILAS